MSHYPHTELTPVFVAIASVLENAETCDVFPCVLGCQGQDIIDLNLKLFVQWMISQNKKKIDI
jgi:hypothetical protein